MREFLIDLIVVREFLIDMIIASAAVLAAAGALLAVCSFFLLLAHYVE